jgi:aminomethyltransferase
MDVRRRERLGHEAPGSVLRCARNVALCRMATQYAEIGTDVEVGKLDGLQKQIAAKVVRFPFYDPDTTRPRS